MSETSANSDAVQAAAAAKGMDTTGMSDYDISVALDQANGSGLVNSPGTLLILGIAGVAVLFLMARK